MTNEQKYFMGAALHLKSKKGYKDGWLYMVWTKRYPNIKYPGNSVIFRIPRAHPKENFGQIEAFKDWLYQQ